MKSVVMISGIPPGPTGTGRFVKYLKDQGATLICSTKFEVPPHRMINEKKYFTVTWKIFLYFLGKFVFSLKLMWFSTQHDKVIVLLHPQFIGMKRTVRLIQKSRSDFYLYLLDNGYFCIRSYNHLPGSIHPCLECIGGKFNSSSLHQCKPGPIASQYANQYVVEIQKLVRDGSIKVIAQCKTQANLARQHFGVEVPVVGLWAQDWDHVFDERNEKNPDREKSRWDVVYHGAFIEEKGVFWLLRIAEQCPELKFFFPFDQSLLKISPPGNCTFRDIRWETGLQKAIEESRIVAVPSLWSAPVEGALIKSIVTAKAVAVVATNSSYSMEMPDNLLLFLPGDTKQAAKVLKDAVKNNWQPDVTIKEQWITDFESRNRNAYTNILNEINRGILV